MKIIQDKLSKAELIKLSERFENMVKAVVDVEKEWIAVDAAVAE